MQVLAFRKRLKYAQIQKGEFKHGYCMNFNQPQLTEYLNGLAGMEKRPDIKYFQLDVGYCTSIGD